MAVYTYSWDDPGAPVLHPSTLGNFTTILDACLVGTSGTAYGSKASMGWTLAYTATNQRAYRQPTGTCQFYLQVNDNVADILHVRAYEAMSDITTGTNPFPHTTAQATFTIDKPMYTANTQIIPWKLYSNGKIFYFVFDGSSNFVTNTAAGVAYGTAPSYVSQPRSRSITFGNFESYLAGDAYNCILVLPNPQGTNENFAGYISNSLTIMYAARNYLGAAGGRVMGRNCEGGWHTKTTVPSPMFGGSLELSRISIYEPTIGLRGFFPGIWYVISNSAGALPVSYNLKDHYMETSCGRDLELLPAYVSNTLAYEISDTWDTYPITNYI